MNRTIFAVGNEPYCLWEVDVAERTRDFLNGLDPEFFSYLLDAHAEPDEEKNEKRSSMAIRFALHHATETMFSLLGAFVQAPLCPYAWVAQCRTEELREVVRRIGVGDESLLAGWKRPFTGWEHVATTVLDRFEPGSDRQQRVIQGFAKTWAGLAGELLSDVVSQEYNAIKHGFRTRAGGFSLAFGREATPGIPAPESAMTTLGQSRFGSMFYKVERHKMKGGRHLTSRRTSLNWSIERDTLLLELAQFSIHNVISALKVLNGADPDTCVYHYPAGVEEDFAKPWTFSPGVTSMNLDFVLDPSQLPELSKEDLLKELRGKGADAA